MSKKFEATCIYCPETNRVDGWYFTSQLVRDVLSLYRRKFPDCTFYKIRKSDDMATHCQKLLDDDDEANMICGRGPE